MQDMISQLLSAAQKNPKGKFRSGDRVVEYDFDNNSYMVKITEEPSVPEFIREFREQIARLDDDVFVEACDLMNKTTDGGVKKLAELCDSTEDYGAVRYGINEFKQCVNAVIGKKIHNLENMRM